ncbi:MAG TPA: hypothetical protein VHJ38_01170 [Nitrososphaeraceae archaeon]|nr:hypothetical protein [Nitrososphaeraceae archaeon]
MKYNYSKIKPIYHCEIVIDEKLDLLKKLTIDGRISVDHFSIKGDHVIMVLNNEELDLLKKIGFKIRVAVNILERIDK